MDSLAARQHPDRAGQGVHRSASACPVNQHDFIKDGRRSQPAHAISSTTRDLRRRFRSSSMTRSLSGRRERRRRLLRRRRVAEAALALSGRLIWPLTPVPPEPRRDGGLQTGRRPRARSERARKSIPRSIDRWRAGRVLS
jgi:hypothetical protein